MLLAANALISVTPGLMIWTIVCFLIALFVLKRYAFGPIQKMIDARREQIRQSIEEADNAREEARQLLEEHRKLIAEAKAPGRVPSSSRLGRSPSPSERAKEETEADRQRRLEETKRQIEAETERALEQIRSEVASLRLIAARR